MRDCVASFLVPTRASVARALLMAQACASVPVLGLAMLLTVCAETAGGRWAGLAFLIGPIGLLGLWLLVFRRTRRPGFCAAAPLAASGLLCLGIAYARSPANRIPPGNFSQHFRGNTAFRRMSLTNIVPEVDQLKLGSVIAGLLDPFIDSVQAARIRTLFLDVYGELERDEAFREAGSALGMCYEDLFLGRRDTLHFYEYVPRQLGRKTYPVLFFLHGSLGNFKGYPWVLKRVADEAGVAVICPSFGCGDWRRDPGCEVLRQALLYCYSRDELDESALYLAGLSNGGMGVTRAVQDHGHLYRGVVYLSPVMEPEIVEAPGFLDNARRTSFLILHGEADRRIPARSVRACETILKRKGVTVKAHYYPGEDHFLFFSQRDAVTREIAEWIREKSGSEAAERPQ